MDDGPRSKPVRPDTLPEAVQEAEYWFPYHYVARHAADGFTQTFDDTWGINYLSTIEFLLEHLDNVPFTTAIDVGCGTGRFTRELIRRFPERRVIGTDMSRRAIVLARAMNPDLPQSTFLEGDLTAAAPQGPFDLCVLMEVFEHVHPDRAADFVKGVRGLLREQGTLLLTVPHVNSPLIDKHYRHFDCQLLLAELGGSFKAHRVVPFERRGLQMRLLKALLSNRFFVLNHPRLRRWLYRHYRARLFLCDREEQCQRLFVHAIAT